MKDSLRGSQTRTLLVAQLYTSVCVARNCMLCATAAETVGNVGPEVLYKYVYQAV
jgi:hypothetical protein